MLALFGAIPFFNHPCSRESRPRNGNQPLCPMRTNFYLPLSLLLLTLLGACSSSRQTTGATPGHSEALTSAEGAAALQRARNATERGSGRRHVIDEASAWLGTPYKYGGSTRSGADCSGFVSTVYKTAAGRKLPRSSRDQAGAGNAVDINKAKPGDLLFFNTSGGGVSHVGIYLGNRTFIHASTSRGVIYSSLDEQYYKSRFLFARTVLS